MQDLQIYRNQIDEIHKESLKLEENIEYLDLVEYIKKINPEKLGLVEIIINNISKISKGFVNENYIINISGKKFLFRVATEFTDGFYGGKLEFEKQVLDVLSKLSITPKVYFYDKNFKNGILIEEFIEGKQEFIFNNEINYKVSNTIKILQSIKGEYNFLTKENSIEKYVRKYKLWLEKSKNNELKEMFKKIESLIIFNKDFNQLDLSKYVLSHNDLRLDNLIISNNGVYLIDLEGMSYGDEILDISGYYSGNLFFEKFGNNYIFSKDDLINWLELFSKDKLFIKKGIFFVILQFFSDLCWLDNYINTDKKNNHLKYLFNKNINIFKKDILTLTNNYENILPMIPLSLLK